LAGSGNQEAPVTRKPRVAVIPTGSELVPIETAPQAGQIIEYNSLVLAAQVESWGGRPTRWPIVADDRAAIEAAVREAAREHDLVLINAGSSAGLEDYTADVVARLGSLLVHGVAVRPGHPVVLGMLDPVPGKDLPTPIIGVPGYPVSAALTGEIFVEPLLARWLGRQAQRATQVEATMSRKVHSSLGDDEYLRVTVGKVGERLVAAPLSRGAGVISSLVRADGIVVIPAGTQGIQAGDPVQVRLYREREEIERTLVVLGSHDLTIDLMAQFLAQTGGRLVSANVGSLGGLIALRRAEAHLAGSHLLDPESGEYNLSYIRRYLPGTPVTVVGLVDRQQGLIVATGNPLQIGGLEDLNRDQISFINRQRGAGTRVLLDYNLDLKGIPFQSVNGYDREEFTHLAVAAAVASGRADCGLGIQAAAMALELDFIPLFQERYDLIIPNEHFESSQLQPLLALLEDESFRNAVQALPGYDIKPMGSIIAQLE
jgi:putative molybdopterin biosynthesis protein